MEGFLEKEPAIVGRTQRRYFVATRVGDVVRVEYFVDETRQVKKGAFDVDLSGAADSVSVQSIPGPGFAFSVEVSCRRYVLKAASPQEREAWMMLFSRPEVRVRPSSAQPLPTEA
eukprot:m.87544 g.87544  ORF g.87544 m.87544 type:complete len:115 (+) comp15131_c2_seq2:487-831(+)